MRTAVPNMPFRRDRYLLSFKYVAATLAVIGQCCVVANAQTKPDTSKTYQLRDVQIWGNSNGLAASSPTPAQVLRGAALERLNNLSVADAIRYFSGTQLKDYGGVGGLKTVDVRSLGSSQVAVFYDGVQLGNAQNGQVDLSKFSLDNIGEIELYNAQKSTIFQPARGLAAGSAIYLTAKAPQFRDGHNDVVKAAIRTGSMGLFAPSLLWAHQLSTKVSSSVSTEYIQGNGRYKFRYTNGVFDTTAIRQNGDIQAFRSEVGFQGQLADSSSWSVKGYLYTSQRGLPGAIVSNRFNYTQREWDRNLFIQSAYQRLGKVYSLMAHAKYANDLLRYLDPDIVTVNGLSDSRYHQQELYLSLVNKFNINTFWSTVLSTDYIRNTMQSNIYRFAEPTRNTLLAALATQLKFDRLDVQGNLLGNFVTEHTNSGTSAPDRIKYTPALMASWQPLPDPSFRFRGFYKSIYRIPTFNELYYTFIGTADLQPEFSRQYDAGFTFQRALQRGALKQISIQTDAYYNKVDNKIIAVPGQNLRRWTMQNVGKVNIKGIETNIRSTWQLNSLLLFNGGLSYTYQQALDASADAIADQQIPYTPVNSGTVLAGLLWRKLSLNYSFVYTGERYDQRANIPQNRVEPWYTHDLSVNYQTRLDEHQLKLGADVNNVFNQYYDVIANYPMPGRYYRFNISFTY
ncbi:TonB-dependent receptor [Mucilaginibacter daejeonensis]|uniref:TonB-dependent receptor n=1 Tax=Mucilaginibacter daejeonensis TaxID=398049 RepID=UPI001D172F3B|nr:TonB-dependent receptor [Mucilaginibacter daejeonensis]UEG55172.1 TonB-dependent receptor [Mucilaginibacter daejeonensis]